MVGVHGGHVEFFVDAVDGLHIAAELECGDRESRDGGGVGAVVFAGEAVEGRGIEKQILRRAVQDDLGIVQVKGDVPLAGPLVEDRGRHRGGIGKGVAENQAAPAAIQDDAGLVDDFLRGGGIRLHGIEATIRAARVARAWNRAAE